MAKAKKPVMTFSELVYAIQNRGKSMNLKDSPPMSLAKEDSELEEAKKEGKPTTYTDWLKKGKPVGGWKAPPAAPQPIKGATKDK